MLPDPPPEDEHGSTPCGSLKFRDNHLPEIKHRSIVLPGRRIADAHRVKAGIWWKLGTQEWWLLFCEAFLKSDSYKLPNLGMGEWGITIPRHLHTTLSHQHCPTSVSNTVEPGAAYNKPPSSYPHPAGESSPGKYTWESVQQAPAPEDQHNTLTQVFLN